MQLVGTSMTHCLLLATLTSSCGDDDVDSDKEARQAYSGLDGLVETAIDLGFRGMNVASGANIMPQMAMGAMGGTITVTGKVDQGSSNNKNMDLALALAMFTNDGKIRYDSPVKDKPAPALVLSLKKIPDGTLDGTLIGDFAMAGDLEGNVALNLVIVAALETDPADATKVRRKAGSTHTTGTAVSSEGTYTVDVTR
jgi:hypothetical protein